MTNTGPHDISPALVPRAGIEWMADRTVYDEIKTLREQHGITIIAQPPLEPPAPMPEGWNITGNYIEATNPGRLIRVIALMAWGPDGCSVWQLEAGPGDNLDILDLDTRAMVAGVIALADDPLRIPGVETVKVMCSDYEGMVSHVFIARELTGGEFAAVVGHDLPLIDAYDLPETYRKGPGYKPVRAPWKEERK